MAFLLRNNVKMSSAAREKLLADFWATPDRTQVTVLFYVIQSTSKAPDGKVLSEKNDFFGWGAHWKSDVPPEAIWELDGRIFVIQDGRWEPHQKLLLDVIDGQLRMKPHKTGNGR